MTVGIRSNHFHERFVSCNLRIIKDISGNSNIREKAKETGPQVFSGKKYGSNVLSKAIVIECLSNLYDQSSIRDALEP